MPAAYVGTVGRAFATLTRSEDDDETTVLPSGSLTKGVPKLLTGNGVCSRGRRSPGAAVDPDLKRDVLGGLVVLPFDEDIVRSELSTESK